MEKENNIFNDAFKELLNEPSYLGLILKFINTNGPMIPIKIIATSDSNNHYGVIFTARETKTAKMQKIIISAFNGEPNLEQIRRVTYDVGLFCDKRIIFYTKDFPNCLKNEYRHEHEMVKGFAKVNNDCGFETFVIEVSLVSDVGYKFAYEVKPNEYNCTSLKNLPSKYDFERAIFKVFYNQTDWYEGYEHVEHMEDIGGWFDGTYWCLDTDGIEYIYPVWNEEGLFAQAVSVTEEGAYSLESIKENNLKNLGEMFINREITFEKDFSENVTMSIKLWDKPFSYFIESSIEDKEKIAEFLREFDSKISEYWDHQHYLKGPENSTVKEHLSVPEDAFNELEQEIST